MKGILAIIGFAVVAAGVWWYYSRDIPVTLPESAREGKEVAELPDIELMSKTVTFDNGNEAMFQVGKPFEITVAAEGLGKARFIAESPDGRLFIPDLVDYRLSHEGKIFILDNFNEETKQFETKHTYLENLRGPNSVAFYTDDDGNHWIYIALTEHLIRYPYVAGDTAPVGEPEIIAEFPNEQTPGEESVVWHITRTLLFHDGRLYVAIGSGCNSCEELEDVMRGMIISMDPDGGNRRVYADGLRNSVGIEWADLPGQAGDSLFATANGVDHLGSTAPDERMFQIEQGENYGWPYCYELDSVIYEETSQEWERDFSCEDAPRSFAAFAPRSAPLGLTYFVDAHPTLQNSFLVALHGSFEPKTGTGYEVVRVSMDGEKEVFIDGFQLDNLERVARPVHIYQKDGNSFFLTDDHGGRLFYIYVPS